jgi:hypothetical protein
MYFGKISVGDKDVSMSAKMIKIRDNGLISFEINQMAMPHNAMMKVGDSAL